MTTRLDEVVGSVEYDGLIVDSSPAADVFSVTIRKLAAEATLARGTVLARSDVDDKMVILGTTPAAGEAGTPAVDEVPAVYTLTEDTALSATKVYYVKFGDEYVAVSAPNVTNIATYYELTTPAVPAVPAGADDPDEVLTADCILADAVTVGTAADVTATAYRTGHFARNKLIVKTGYTFTSADEQALRGKGILLSDAVAY